MIKTGSSDRFSLKLSHPKEDRLLINFRTGAVKHLELHAPSIPVPRLRPTLDAQYETELLTPSGSAVARLLTYIPGEVLTPKRLNVKLG